MRSSMDSWARSINKEEDIPPSFQQALKNMIIGLNEFPYTIYCPYGAWGNIKANPKLICLLNDKIVYLEIIDNSVLPTYLNYEDIITIEHGQFILYSWIKVATYNKTTLIEFSTVLNALFIPILNRSRCAASNIDSLKAPQNIEKLRFLSEFNHKFMIYSSRIILGDENILNILYQPSIIAPFFRFFNKRVSEELLMILTDKELIFISDEDTEKIRNVGKYGFSEFYFPIKKLRDISLLHNDNNTISMILHTRSNISKSFTFSIDKEYELLKLKKYL